MNSDPPKCNVVHTADWLVDYDIEKQQTEQILVCKVCFENPEDDCFRSYVISKTSVEVIQK